MTRPVEPGDAPAVAELLNEYSRRLYGEGELNAAEIEFWWRDPQVEAWIDVGAYADLGRRADDTRLWVDLRGEPSPALLAVVERRAAEVAAPGALLRAAVSSLDDGIRELLDAGGYRYVRSSYTMRAELEAEPDPPDWPEGVDVRVGRAGDALPVYQLYAESFADQWDFHPEPFDDWRRWNLEEPGADPALWVLAFVGEELVGTSLGVPHRSGEPDEGWISLLGVRAGMRGRERAGMHVARRLDTLEKRL